MKTAVSLVVAIALATLGVFLWRFSEADDAPGGVVISWLIILGALVFAVRAVQRRT